MKFDINTATDEEKELLLDAKIIDAVTGEELHNIAALDTETGWRREYVPNLDAPDRILSGDGYRSEVNLGKPYVLVEYIGNPIKIVFPAALP